MKTTAGKFRKKPHDIYAEAAKGETVTINHDRYRDQVFELTARGREPLKKLGIISPDELRDEDK